MSQQRDYTVRTVLFEEDMVCDHCRMEIDGQGVPSGWTEGQEVDGWSSTGWMHRAAKTCRRNIAEHKALGRQEDGVYLGPDFKAPPARG